VLDLVERFEQASVALHSIQESLDAKSAIGCFVLRTLASLAEMERDLISERTKDAMAHLNTAGEAVQPSNLLRSGHHSLDAAGASGRPELCRAGD
jgi:DNA invertase Pin-like site-specific DNA recombinase